MKKTLPILGLMAILLGCLSIWLACKSNLLYENLTYVGNVKANRPFFMSWGILLSFYYAIAYCVWMKTLSLLKKQHILWCGSCCLISTIAFLLPYQNHSGDIVSQLHVYGSMSSCIATYVIVARTIYQLQFSYPSIYHRMNTLFYGILILSLSCIVYIGDISSLAELCLLNGLSFLFVVAIYESKKIGNT